MLLDWLPLIVAVVAAVLAFVLGLLRLSRATAWSRYYEVLMLCNDSAIAEAADTVLQTAASMTRAADRMALDEVGDLVHAQVARFALVAGEAVRARKQVSAMPPHQEQPVGTAA